MGGLLMFRIRPLRQLACFGAALALLSQAALAQSGAETLENLRACSEVGRDAARLACFDGVLAAERAASERASQPERDDTVPLVANAPNPAPERRAAASARRTDAAAATGAAAASEARGAATAAAAQRDTRSDRAPVRDNADRQNGNPANLDPENDESRAFTVVDINDEIPGATRFTSATGRIFVQTSGRTPPGGFPRVPFEAEVQDGALGSLFLVFGDNRRVRGRWAN
jgi:hypothetical protein